ncbi:MAG: helix-turn-helix transcriptional regulator [Bacteroidia bacterium]|nr:helix-turn-helix transcriptional regulator [Bacteroidia bacterium]
MPPTTSSANLQSTFLEQIKNRLAENISFADKLAELLNISRDSAYRRIRGETVLSLDEVKKLCDRFGVSLDALLSPVTNTSLFHHRALSTSYTLEQWLNSVGSNLEYVNGFKTKEMLFAARDMPIFHNFRIPEISTFKMFFWLKTVIKDPQYAGQLFQEEVISVPLLQAGNKLWKLYATVPSVEIWSDEAINETIKQIEFYHECRFFANPKQAGMLCDRLIELINLIKNEAAEGKKTGGAMFGLYENEIIIANNTILARMDNMRIVFINYNLLNLLTTHQDTFCDKTEKYLINLTKNSTLISTSAEKERNKFFNKMKERIEAFKRKLS